MPRARKPFKSFNRNQYIFAVQLTEDNIDDVAQRIGGRVRETDIGLVMRLNSEEGFAGGVKAVIGQYIVVTSIDDATGNYAYGVMNETQFEEDWVVPKPGAKETDEDEESEKDD